jgi:hypothetical protein
VNNIETTQNTRVLTNPVQKKKNENSENIVLKRIGEKKKKACTLIDKSKIKKVKNRKRKTNASISFSATP